MNTISDFFRAKIKKDKLLKTNTV